MFLPFLMWNASLYSKKRSLKEQAAGKYMLWMSPCNMTHHSQRCGCCPKGESTCQLLEQKAYQSVSLSFGSAPTRMHCNPQTM